ncbi:MAG: hypothetical protein DRO11_05985 [Methanobacteriota archaeon]|nr:MAG: hypothetical protein DRO11_05985 [Euryarchaeota archaeon]
MVCLLIYTRREARRYLVRVLILCSLVVICGSMLFVLPFYNYGGASMLILVILFFVSIYLLQPAVSKYRIWAQGASGEELVAEKLSQLPSSYQVFNDVTLPGYGANLDHVVVGPTGVFVVETKSHKGYISYEKGEWLQRKWGRRGTEYFGRIGNPSRQAEIAAQKLASYINKELKDFSKPVSVIPLLVFTNPETILHTNKSPVKVLRPNQVPIYILKHRPKEKLSLEKVARIGLVMRKTMRRGAA